ncbi:MAG: L,D-transpeptidase family protein [Desulfobacteraceae bacterium]|jgi:murein L,D-transpeptidase YafK
MDLVSKRMNEPQSRTGVWSILPGYFRCVLGVLGCIFLLTAAADNQVLARNSRRYQAKAIPHALVYADPDLHGNRDTPYAVIVDKARQKISLYNYRGYWRAVAKWPCSTGKKTGPKEREGDQKTPEGVYFAVRDVGARFLTDTYGTRAMPLDYPNWWDRRRQRSGSAIWLHGTNKPLLARDSNGCVVIENPTMDRLARHIRLNRTPVIIVEQGHLWSVKAARQMAEKILSAADQWHQALMYGSYQSFRRCYAPGQAPSMKWWQRWCRQRRKHITDSSFESRMQKRAIYRSDGHCVLLFDHHLAVNTDSSWVGRRKMYVDVAEDNVFIVGDTYQCVPDDTDDPLFYAWRKLWQKDQQRCKITVPKQDADNT